MPARRGGSAFSATRKTPLEFVCHFVLAPLVTGVTIALTSRGTDHAVDAGILSFLLFLGAALLFRSETRWADLLPFMRVAYGIAAPLTGLAAVLLLKVTTSVPGAGTLPLLAGALASALVTVAPRFVTRRTRRLDRHIPTALIGSADVAEQLARDLELGLEQPGLYRLTGRIALDTEPSADASKGRVPTLAQLSEVGTTVAEHRLRLLILSSEAHEPRVFRPLVDSCLHLPVCVCDLNGFYEAAFGRVPVSDIDAQWFQYLMHPRYRPPHPTLKRGIDVVGAGAVLLLALPLLGVLAALIRLDGGPVLFRQIRIGEGGRPFALFKLRTMRMGSSSTAQWASPDDPRITGVGALLRRTHLDELPQVLNILRGEMSLVGPRPEQPAFVAHLEQALPFYTQRHLVRPGLTGWAQVRCGYAGSDIGSTRKLCHDLFYLKHRTLLLDLVILGETLRTLVADRQYALGPAKRPRRVPRRLPLPPSSMLNLPAPVPADTIAETVRTTSARDEVSVSAIPAAVRPEWGRAPPGRPSRTVRPARRPHRKRGLAGRGSGCTVHDDDRNATEDIGSFCRRHGRPA